jgi:methylated-DNA-[protein]-cysteine S-methyltransferase
MENSFSEKIYSLLKKVPKGKVTTYKDLAHALGTGAYRGVGQALRRNPYAPHVPCHRVVASNGTIGGFGGERDGTLILKKIAMLKKEGVLVKENKVVNFESKRFQFPAHY